MTKLFAVMKREYLQAVRKKMFIIMTILGPILMTGLMAAITLLVSRGLGEKRIAIVDGTGKLEQTIRDGMKSRDVRDSKSNRAAEAADPLAGKKKASLRNKGNFEIVYFAAPEGADLKEAAKPQLDRLRLEDSKKEERLDGVLLIPAGIFENPDLPIGYYSRSSTDLMAQERFARVVGRGVSSQRLIGRGLDPNEIDRLLKDVHVDGIQLSKSGEEKKGGEMNFIIGFIFVALLFIPIMIYGNEIMRGIVQEKNDRVVEILISSMTPMELLSGKILGLAGVGLTQLAIWFTMGGILAGGTGAAAMAAGINTSQFLRIDVLLYFLLFFVLGYLINVCIYAVAGSIVNSEKEAQQMMAPVSMVLIVPWLLLTPIIMNPESTFSTVLSLIPLYTPITMFVRVLVSEPPLWQVGLSVLLSIGTIYALFWLTAKIFRVGILSYGKRPTVPELWRWVKVA